MRSLSALLLLPAAISAVTLDCKHIRVDKQDFNFEALGGPKDVHNQIRHPLFISNTTYTIDICDKLKRDSDIETKYQCPQGTQVCGITREYRPEDKGKKEEPRPQEVTPIAGEFTATEGRKLEPKFTRLKDSSSNDDAKKEGLRIELHGGMSEDKKKQKAIIEMICDKDMEGTEGFANGQKMMGFDAYAMMQKREEGDGKDREDEEPLPDLDKDKALKFVSYKTEKDDVGVLRLEWKTKYACEGAEAPSTPSKGSWGFFTWFLIVVFLLIATYIIFGSWLNYNRYGARGWDLIPHGDTIRDIPYIVKDWTSGVAGRMSSNGNRGGYSAV